MHGNKNMEKQMKTNPFSENKLHVYWSSIKPDPTNTIQFNLYDILNVEYVEDSKQKTMYVIVDAETKCELNLKIDGLTEIIKPNTSIKLHLPLKGLVRAWNTYPKQNYNPDQNENINCRISLLRTAITSFRIVSLDFF